MAVAAFVAFCAAVLLKATSLLEPDDSAYLASIVALSHGELLLTTAQYHALGTELARHGGQGIMQWVQLSSGRWTSEKNPGYPFYAVVFQWMHALRLAPLFAAALASTSLFVAARRWLGRWAGTYAVLLFLGSGAALAFAWRPTMSTFTDAAFIAVGASLVLWAMLARDRGGRHRSLVGLLGFIALELSTSMRYTNVVVLAVTSLCVLALHRAAGLRPRTVAVWLASVAAFGGTLLVFNHAVYGSATKTGYADGVITFAWSAVWPNLQHMPWMLLKAMPAAAMAAAALAWMLLRFLRRHRPGANPSVATRDLLVGLSLAAAWLGLWGLYLAYTWTVGGGGGGGHQGPLGSGALHHAVRGLPGGGAGGPQGGDAEIHLVRFYVPAIGLLALLGAWLLAAVPRWLAALGLTGLVVASCFSFQSLTSAHAVGQHGPMGGGNPPAVGGMRGGGAPGGARPSGPNQRFGPDGDHHGGYGPPPGFDRDHGPLQRPNGPPPAGRQTP